jgi:hypothetical protein
VGSCEHGDEPSVPINRITVQENKLTTDTGTDGMIPLKWILENYTDLPALDMDRVKWKSSVKKKVRFQVPSQ